MANPVKTYFFPPTRENPPDGPIVLGAIIAKNSSVETPLSEEIVPIPTSIKIRIRTEEKWKWIKEKDRDGSIGVFAQFLSSVVGVGGDASTNLARGRAEEHGADRLETRVFTPTQEYVKESLKKAPLSDEFVRAKKGVYMITGVKIAYVASGKTTRTSKHGFELSPSVNLAAASVPITPGMKLSGNMADKEEVSFESSSDYVFAYRLTRIQYMPKQGIYAIEDFRKGALYNFEDQVVVDSSKDERAAHVEGNAPMEIEVIGVEGADTKADDLGMDAVLAVDDDGELCECVTMDPVSPSEE